MNALRTTKIATVALSLSLAAFAVAGCSGGGGSKGSLQKFCSDYVAMANTSQMQGLLADNNNGDTSLADPAHLSGLKHVASAMQKLAKDAPTAIRAEAQLSAKVLKQMASGHPASAEVDAGQTAGDHVDSYAQAQCPGATGAAANANATPTTTSSSFNGAGSSYNGNSSDTSIDDGSSSDACDYSSLYC